MPREIKTYRIDPELVAAMDAVYRRDGVQVSEQVRRGIRMYLESRGALKTDRKRASTRKRP